MTENNSPKKVLVVGSGAREHAICKALKKSSQNPQIFCFASSFNPGIAEIAEMEIGKIDSPKAVLEFAKNSNIEIAIVGPENPLAAGVSDILWENNIPTFGPKKAGARLESSKTFTRDLVQKYGIDASPKYKNFKSLEGVSEFVSDLPGFVIKADGLMGGKGVKVQGDHFETIEQGLEFCQEIIDGGGEFLIEEKLVGQEFSLISMSDGENLIHCPAVQDHKRAFEGDKGPNTGGMGTYSDSNLSLPFLKTEEIEEAREINSKVQKALKKELGEGYIGVLYGGFMATKTGVKLIEYNARFGDPEAMNILSVLDTDFLEILEKAVSGEFKNLDVKWKNEATVCKYVVPEGYPDKPVKNQPIDVSGVENKDLLYYASVDMVDGQLVEKGSRTIAVCASSNSIYEAEKIVESEIQKIKGALFHRKDIGTRGLVESRVEMMKGVKVK